MVNGEAFHDTFPCSALVSDVKQAVVNKKPKELVEFLSSSLPPAQPPTKVDDLRILHLGKFLEDGKSLEGMFVQLLPAMRIHNFPTGVRGHENQYVHAWEKRERANEREREKATKTCMRG